MDGMLAAQTESRTATRKPVFPFTAIVGQEELKLALLLCAVDPMIGGVLALGDRGTGKSTAVRALAQLLPDMQVVLGDPYNAEPTTSTPPEQIGVARVPVVDLPLGASEDRVVGALDLERALTRGEKAFEPGLLARAHRGFLYIDEVNLLEDHLVDLLLDVAASGENVVEREGISLRHPARFVLVGSGNPEEGELRPQLLDRFGLAVDVRTPDDLPTRIAVVKRRDSYERDPHAFLRRHHKAEERQRAALLKARALLPRVKVPDAVLEDASRLCMALGTDGLRGELTLLRTARALAALDGKRVVSRDQLRRIALPSLRHRLRRNPLDDASSSSRVERALAETLPG
ncbi:MAG: magnesium chelatase ATPase subunit I [Alphaproteobacteria bacterium]|jgi:magnesium chelatase subunit I|nr:magnesium chelatase ATPase subunit I [Alphaproteobacteria bacterium]